VMTCAMLYVMTCASYNDLCYVRRSWLCAGQGQQCCQLNAGIQPQTKWHSAPSFLLSGCQERIKNQLQHL